MTERKTKEVCNDFACPKHGQISLRGRSFKGTIIKKFPKRIVVELERTVRIAKYERFTKKKTRLHARIPENMDLHVGDLVKVRECRPLSKIIHFIVTDVIKSKGAGK